VAVSSPENACRRVRAGSFLSWEYFVHISPLFSRGAVAGGPPTLLTDQG